MRRLVIGVLVCIVAICAVWSAVWIEAFATRIPGSEWMYVDVYVNGAIETHYSLPVNLYIDGVRIDYFGDMPPMILMDRLFLPLRELFELLGATVTWNEDISQVFIDYDDVTVSLRSDSHLINVNGELTEIPLPPKNVNGRVMVPVSFMAEVFGITVDWFAAARTAVIDSGRQVFAQHPEPSPHEPPPVVTTHHIVDHHVYQGADAADVPILIIDENVPTGPVHLDRAIEVDPRPIESMNLPQTGLVSVDFPLYNPHVFYIRAAEGIAGIQRFLLYDNRLVIDLYNVENRMEVNEIHVVNSSILQRIRVGQGQIDPQPITRVVFDLLEPVSYSVSLSEDRTTVIVSMHRNDITAVNFRTDGFSDFIYIQGHVTPVVNIFPHTLPGQFIIEIPLGSLTIPVQAAVDGVFARSIQAEQIGPATARIVLTMAELAAHSVVFEGNTTIVRLSMPTHANISYCAQTRRIIIPRNPDFPIEINRIVESDDYLNFQYVFVLPGDFSALFGEGDYIIRDDFLSHINVSTVSNRTSIRVFQQRILAYRITESPYNIYFQAMLPREKYDRIVVIDPGHGGSDPGTISACGLRESDLALDISLRLAALLENNGVKTYLTRLSDVYVQHEDRAHFANGLGDIFVSVHLNAWYTTTPQGTETYYWPERYSYYIPYGFMPRATFAEIMQRNILESLNSTDRTVKQTSFRVLRYTTIPSVLLEFGFMTNPTEMARLATEAYRQLCAEGAFNGIMEVFTRYRPRR